MPFFLRKITLSVGFFICAVYFNANALDTDPLDISDDSALRLSLVKDWLTETPSTVLSKKPFIAELPSGDRVRVGTENSPAQNEFVIILARELNGAFPGWAQGSWILTRDSRTGEPEKIRVFLRSDPYTYVQFRPQSNTKSLLDVVIYDANIVQSLIIPMTFTRLLTTPLNDIFESISERVPLKFFSPKTDNYRDSVKLIAQIRKNLPSLEYADDGAIDENGNYVFINNLEEQTKNQGLNCSGFAKWLVDGILRPYTGKGLEITPLKQAFGNRGSDFTEPYERSRDPFFGLDWVRNLAATAATVLKAPSFASLDEIEVRDTPFSSTIKHIGKTSKIIPYVGYLPDAGYEFTGLQALLYTLAINEPGNIYLGAVNNEKMPKPRMRQYYHVAAFIPYFDEYSIFHIAVFESAVETNFNKFRGRYTTDFINLVRIPVEKNFQPN
ncbi:MAG: hypothetical protein LBV52_06590 [Spirochaetaceae bacterium]|jgi:hypothetical protein|nr:hypothetical protein [Spirochaetaceae bacterium]